MTETERPVHPSDLSWWTNRFALPHEYSRLSRHEKAGWDALRQLRPSCCRCHVGPGEVAAFEKERLPRSLRERIGKAVAEVMEDVTVAFPDLTIVLDHMSYPYTEQATYMLYAHTNVHVDVGVVAWDLGRAGFHRLLRQVVETVGCGKILFGSDMGRRPDTIAVAVEAIQQASFLSEYDKGKILGGNARKLLELTAGTAHG
jgi:predicted TIM-barrel fold metal-dependent hydrolase